MLSKLNFTKDHITSLQKKYRRDPSLIERTIFAFGMLEAIARVKLPFIFKGGTSLMLLLEHPARLSTDIDIIVKPGTDIDEYLKEASLIFPFTKFEEQIRKGKNNIEKRHFKFSYTSPTTSKEIYILLDVVFEDNNYANLIEREIKNELLLTEEPAMKVAVPDINCILGDKLTAFAPHTTGIPLGEGKDLEVIKQMYDIVALIKEMDNIEIVKSTYQKVSASETEYRGRKFTYRDCLIDTINTASCVAARGKINNGEYQNLLRGAREIENFIYAENFTPEIAAISAPIIMSFAASLLEDKPFEKFSGEKIPAQRFRHAEFAALNYIRKINTESYFYVCKADEILP